MKPLNTAQARILRTKVNVANAELARMQDTIDKLRMQHGVDCHRARAVKTALSAARRSLEEADDALRGVELDDIAAGGPREPVTRPRFR